MNDTMNAIHDKELALFKRWTERSIQLGEGDNLAEDGLLYRGAPTSSEVNGIFYWETNPANEEELWNNADKRLLIITKDLNNQEKDGSIAEAWDIRVETGFKNTEYNEYDYESCIPFYKRLRMWSYGLLNTTEDGIYPSYETARDQEISGPFYIQAPIARINCKKQCGGATLPEGVLLEYLQKYKDLLIEQIKLYHKADIIFCGAHSGCIKDFIKKYVITDLEEIEGTNNWIYYSPSTDKVIINGYHPTSRTSYENVYNEMMEAYSVFMKNKK